MRIERKYIFKKQYLEAVLSDLRVFCKGINKYKVSSTYLDNSNEELYRQKIDGDKDKIKLRVRHYDENSHEANVEAKIKHADKSYKLKMALEIDKLDSSQPISSILDIGKSLENNNIAYLLKHHCLRNYIEINYQRYEMVANSCVGTRVTIDFDVFSKLTVPWPANKIRCLSEELCIFEIKNPSTNVSYPLKTVLEKYQMKQRAISKFSLGVQSQKLNMKSFSNE